MTWMQTSTGGTVDLANPYPPTLRIEDIAIHLSRLCRFTGAVDVTIGQHVLTCYQAALAAGLPWDVCRWALLHDAHEAYMGDLSRPLKMALGCEVVKRVEERIQVAICTRFGLALTPEIHARVQLIDDMAMRAEFASLSAHPAVGAWDEQLSFDPELTECVQPVKLRGEALMVTLIGVLYEVDDGGR